MELCNIQRQRRGLPLVGEPEVKETTQYQIRSKNGRIVYTTDSLEYCRKYQDDVIERHGANAPVLSFYRVMYIEEQINV